MTPRRLAWAALPLLAVVACAPQPSAPPQQAALVCPPDPPAGSGYRCAPPPPAPFCRYLPAVSAGVDLLFGGDTKAVADDLLDAARRLGCPAALILKGTRR